MTCAGQFKVIIDHPPTHGAARRTQARQDRVWAGAGEMAPSDCPKGLLTNAAQKRKVKNQNQLPE